MKPPIITSSPTWTKARVLMLPSRDAGVGEGVGVGVGLCADKSATATTVNAKTRQKLIRALPKTPPMNESGSKTASFGKRKFCGCRKISKWFVMWTVQPPDLRGLVEC